VARRVITAHRPTRPPCLQSQFARAVPTVAWHRATHGTTTYDPAAGYQVRAVLLPTAAGKEHQTVYAYDARDRLDTITVQLCTTSGAECAPGGIVTGTQRVVDDYGYDANDNRTSVAEDNGAGALTTTYGYDGRNQLVTDSSGGTACPGGQAYGYDEAGNRTCAAGRTFGYANGTGQLESCTGTACAPIHDADGRITRLTTASGTWSYLYDGESRLVSACRSTSCTGSGFARLDSVYDGEGHRVRLVETPASGTPTATDFAYQGDAVVRETAVTGTTTVTRTFTVDEAGTIVRMTVAGMGTPNDGDYLVTWNGHGDAVELARIDPGTGLLSPANRFTYSAWGTPALATVGAFGDLGFRYRYVGRHDVQLDSTAGVPAELLYMHARHYIPEVGRYLQPDPSAAEANLYAYTANSPITNVDPSGLWMWPWDYLTYWKQHAGPFEKAYCDRIANTWPCVANLVASAVALQFGKDTSASTGNGQAGDAIRHCTWQCLLTAFAGRKAAAKLAQAHEQDNMLEAQAKERRWLEGRSGGDRNAVDREILASGMDRHNNRVGQSLAPFVIGLTGSVSGGLAMSLCRHALYGGDLWVIQGGHVGPYRRHNGG
jgi:RHS repeat-associated protein